MLLNKLFLNLLINIKNKVKKLLLSISNKRYIIIVSFLTIIYLSYNIHLAIKEYNKPFAKPQIVDLAPAWAVNLGNQISQLRQKIPTINQVVIVPDTDTFLVAIQDWNLKKRYPILIEDQKYTPMFINSFKPEKIINLPSVKPLKQEEKFNLIQQAIANAWEAKNYQSLKETWQQLGWNPPGIVITSKSDPACMAAVALAADRGQPLVFLEEDFGLPNDTFNLKQWKNLKEKIENLVKNTGYSYNKLGDNIDTITLVKNLAVKYQSPQNRHEQLAVTDGLAKDKNGNRWAITGWIYGTSIRAVYMAMCSIFLEHKTAFLYDSYDNTEPWINYQMETSAADLKKQKIKVDLWQKPKSSIKTWLKLTKNEWNYDLILINSKGISTSFDVGNNNAFVDNIPNLKVPAMLHFIHSWSATSPDDINTVGGRWLDNGIYAYVGSVHEPYLHAFIPPNYLIKRMISGVPFLIASRYLESPNWKITTIGDPLLILNQPNNRISLTNF